MKLSCENEHRKQSSYEYAIKDTFSFKLLYRYVQKSDLLAAQTRPVQGKYTTGLNVQ